MSDADEKLVADRVEHLLASNPPATTSEEDFWRAQFDLGLAWVRFPEGLGGLGLDGRWQTMIDDRIEQAGGSRANRERNVVGIAMGGPTLVQYASPELQQSMLRPMFSTEEIWCQLFSEPGAGSDIAGLATSARRVVDDDTWVVSGQKVWTTLAHEATWGLLLARTDPDQPKHRGLTYFVVDMRAPGVDVRPLYEMTGEAEFNEVYLDEVVIPDTHRLGRVGEGWKVALTTLMNERASAGRAVGPRGSGAISTARRVWEERGHRDPVRRHQLARLWVEAEALRLTELRAAAASGQGTPGPEGSAAKLRWSELNQRVTEFTLDLLGADAMTFPGDYEFVRPSASQVSDGSPQKRFLRARANTIEGGSSQIMRNILGERVLGLPGEERSIATMPWKDIPRG